MQVRWSDVDLFGHVNNAAFLRYLDDARFSLFSTMGVDERGAMTDSLLVVVKHEIDYRSPLTFRPTPFEVQVWVPHVGRSSVDFAYEIHTDERVVLTARSRMVQLQAADHAPLPFTPAQKAVFERFSGESPTLRSW